MSHYNVKYEGDGAEDKAMRDIAEWLGEERFAVLNKELPAACATREEMRMALTFAGITGFPVEVWADRLGYPKGEQNDIC